MTSLNFAESVSKHFGFLKTDYGFDESLNDIGYEKNGLAVHFHHGNGQLDVVFLVTKDDEIFRPSISRIFYFTDIVRKLKGGKLYPPDGFPLYLTDDYSIENYLAYYAELMQRYCTKQLQGELVIFEKIHLARRAASKAQY